jgi:methyl-accepting chemotaxis protein
MKNKTGIGFRIITMAVIISVIAGIIGSIGLFTTKRTASLIDEIYHQDLLCILYTEQMHSDLQTYAYTIEKSGDATPEEIAAYKTKIATLHENFVTAYKNGQQTLQTERGKELYAVIEESEKEYVKKAETYFNLLTEKRAQEADTLADTDLAQLISQKIQPSIEELVKLVQQKAVTAYTTSTDTAQVAIILIIAAVFAGLALSLTIGIFIARSITKPVTRIVNGLSDSAGQIAISSSQLSSSSQEIANGAQEQASSIEETTASMEELSSMVKQNLATTRQASLISEKATDATQNGFDKMTAMLSAMNGISKSAEDIKNVIDVIDDIAFQTNMLALNAAVEAARAGEAGMGFAVVADEVKNLANRSSESAKETAAMIKETLKNVESGMTISNELSGIFKDILTNSKKVMEMNREVETASGQQDEGIDQVNKALIQLDAVVQANAAGAEETASAAEELQGQVTNVNDIMNDLYQIVTGKYYENSVADRTTPVHAPVQKQQKPAVAVRKNASLTAKPVAAKPAAQKVSPAPEHSISFEDDEEFKPV